MSKLLLDQNNAIIFMSEAINYGVFEGEEKWKVAENLYCIDNNYSLVEVAEIPQEVIAMKYCYTQADGFYLNPKWVEPPKSAKEQLAEARQALIDSGLLIQKPSNNCTLTEYKVYKNKLLSAECHNKIIAGVTVTTTTGSHHFKASENDQLNVATLYNAMNGNANATFPYQADDEGCRLYTTAEITAIYNAMTQNKTALLTKYHALKEYINRCTDKDSVSAINWNSNLPSDIAYHVAEILQSVGIGL